MKLTKKQETEVLKVYDIWMHSYLNGDVKTYDSFLDDEYRFIGSTDNEDFLNRKDTTKFFEATAEQLAGQVEIRNSIKTIEKFDELIFVTDLFDAYFRDGADWAYYGKFRFTSALKMKDEGWRFIYQHFSTPDSKAQEGETIGTEKIAAENLQLREAIQRRTVELNHKNRELEIETALERVRARTMAMQNSKELNDVAYVLFEQLRNLGGKLWGTGVALCKENSDTDEFWFANENGILPPVNIPHTEDPVHNKLYNEWLNKSEIIAESKGGNDLRAHYTYMLSLPEVKHFFQVILDNGLTFPEWQQWNAAYFSHGYLMVITIEPYPEPQTLIRFASVFQQAYTRFLDLQKAEAQAREVQIELSLERIRSQAMAMQISSDLLDIVVTMRNEFTTLGHEAHYFWHMRWLHNTYEKAMTSGDGTRIGMVMELPRGFHEDQRMLDWEQTNTPIGVFTYDAEGAIDYVDKMVKTGRFDLVDHNAPGPDDIRHIGGITFIMARTKHGEIGYSLPGIVAHPPKEDLATLARFAGVFDLAYRRFEDLKKSEQINRETQIELALERVRSRTMAMKHSDELGETSFLLDSQIRALGIETRGCAFHIYGENESTEWFSSETGTMPTYKTPRENIFLKYYEAGQRGESLLIEEFADEACVDHYDYLCSLPIAGESLRKFKENGGSFPTRQIDHVAFFEYGYLLFISLEPVPDSYDIFKRFAKVFEQTYTRFLDLQKAEEQAREAQIEAALEKVRSRSLAMHAADELGEVVTVLVEKLIELNVVLDANGVVLCTYFQNSKDVMHWIARPDLTFAGSYLLPYFDHPIFNDSWQSKESGADYFSKAFSIQEKNSFFEYAFEHSDYRNFPDDFKKWVFQNDKHILSFAWQKNSAILIPSHTGVVPSANEVEILKRFAKAFEQAYTRFLDLQKAEEQAREGQIEAALERVRSRSLAMRKSNEVQDIVNIVFENLRDLNIETDVTSVIILKEDMFEMDYWVANSDNIFSTMFRILHNDEIRILKDVMIARKKNVDFSKSYSFEEKNELWSYLFEHSDLRNIPEERKKFVLTTNAYATSVAFTKNAAVQLNRYFNKPFTVKENEILKRFAVVFEQAYVRFLDLKKAESQAREAQIEASLERIRAQAMAMQNSNDLIKSTTILFEEFEKLKLSVDRSGIGIFDDKTRDCHLWTTVVTPDGKTELTTGITSMTRHPMLIKTFDAWKTQKTLLWVLEGKELEDYYNLVSESEFHLPEEVVQKSASLQKEYYLYTPFGAGGLYVFSDTEPSKEEKQIIRRFAEVFHLTYTRYEDLQKAEARALEAEKQASLDRVRGEIASMRNKDDLNRITPLIWQELNALEVSFIRCGVLIMNNNTEIIQTHLSTPNGESLGIFELPYSSEYLAKSAIKHWRKNEIFKTHWNKNEFIAFMQNLLNTGKIKNSESFTGSSAPPESLYLNFIPFKQGMLYVGNTNPLNTENLQLVESLAKAFSIAFSRYEDFTKLEEAKNKIEHTLSELKAAQTQLIHAEKMASLGELTAGIAHEIQNPLNFVNNFSEVSIDLLEEMEEEMANGNTEEVIEITSDIKQNLDKIGHHGKRASSIVKGMLEHSRAGSQKKELSDINNLADEYLRLSYHGLRAKDKSFNADFEMIFDDSIPKIKIISQDMGRVFLNLFNNAFYACAERSKTLIDNPDKGNTENYKPKIIVSTKKIMTPSGLLGIEISVEDNGDGIPKDILDKIFQPFFTTKPTGKGTGLGLSLSYDIIKKGHGGELTVKTKMNLGTEFIITLPIE